MSSVEDHIETIGGSIMAIAAVPEKAMDEIKKISFPAKAELIHRIWSLCRIAKLDFEVFREREELAKVSREVRDEIEALRDWVERLREDQEREDRKN